MCLFLLDFFIFCFMILFFIIWGFVIFVVDESGILLCRDFVLIWFIGICFNLYCNGVLVFIGLLGIWLIVFLYFLIYFIRSFFVFEDIFNFLFLDWDVRCWIIRMIFFIWLDLLCVILVDVIEGVIGGDDNFNIFILFGDVWMVFVCKILWVWFFVM